MGPVTGIAAQVAGRGRPRREIRARRRRPVGGADRGTVVLGKAGERGPPVLGQHADEGFGVELHEVAVAPHRHQGGAQVGEAGQVPRLERFELVPGTPVRSWISARPSSAASRASRRAVPMSAGVEPGCWRRPRVAASSCHRLRLPRVPSLWPPKSYCAVPNPDLQVSSARRTPSWTGPTRPIRRPWAPPRDPARDPALTTQSVIPGAHRARPRLGPAWGRRPDADVRADICVRKR